MTRQEAPRLLARDKAQLRDVAAALAEPRTLVAFVVCEAPMRSVALTYLREKRGVAIADPIALVEPQQTLRALIEVEGLAPSDLRSFLVVHSEPDVVRTLNWHREKLRRGASVLLWIDGVDGLRVLRRLGPDAYSFRDMIVMIHGEAPVVVAEAVQDSIDVQLARQRCDAAAPPLAEAIATAQLVIELLSRGAKAEARQRLEQTWDNISHFVDASEQMRMARAQLCLLMSMLQPSGVHDFNWKHKGLAELEGLAGLEARQVRIRLLAEMPTPLGFDVRSVSQALIETQEISARVEDGFDSQSTAWISAARLWTIHGDMKRAKAELKKTLARRPIDARYLIAIWMSDVQQNVAAGQFERALATLHGAWHMRRHAGLDTFAAASWIATCHRLTGEYDAARVILDDIIASCKSDGRLVSATKAQLTHMVLIRGDVSQAMCDMRAVLREALSTPDDALVFDTSRHLVELCSAVRQAQAEANAEITDVLGEIDMAEHAACTMAGSDVPWYSILFPALRAECLALRHDGVAQAIEIVNAVVDRARVVFPDAVPQLVRQLACHFLQAGRLEEARATLDTVIPEVATVGHLRELARLRAYAIVTLVRAGAPAVDADIAMHALRETFDEMAAPRMTADTLLELAELLPVSSSHPDPYALADEASSLYAEMPYPLREARSLEVMGDVLAARGDAAGALRCHRNARGICENFGLGLRLRVLDGKIATLEPSSSAPIDS